METGLDVFEVGLDIENQKSSTGGTSTYLYRAVNYFEDGQPIPDSLPPGQFDPFFSPTVEISLRRPFLSSGFERFPETERMSFPGIPLIFRKSAR